VGAALRAMPDDSSPFVREALLQQQEGNKVRCLTCERRCVLVDGGVGWCRTRRNVGGRLVTLAYGAVSSLAANPIEKKPFYHFYPGTRNLTAGGWSCNFGCPWCQNWEISKRPPPASGDYLAPEQFVRQVEEADCQGTSISFNEPTLSLEWSLEVFRLAGARGYYNTFVTNGYMTPEALKLLADAGLHAMNVDIKGDAEALRKHCKLVEAEKIWANCRLARICGIHLELTTLVIPGVNDQPEVLEGIAQRIAAELGRDTPWHVNAYCPAWRFTAPPTPAATLERAWRIGREAGLHFVYIGNLRGHRAQNTYCPRCGAALIVRSGLAMIRNDVRQSCCPWCRCWIEGVWQSE
jgi:pyruvate formate lyase activating enzyme